ncbi:MAG: PAS domain S-box protein [Myxococcales bacterium]|nr:PAS domain S-box protein [Myxococcales bacterium]
MNGELPEGVLRPLFTELIRHVPMAVAAFDRDMRYLAHSPTWLSAHGDSSGREIIGRSHYDVFPSIRAEWRDIHRRCLAGATERSELDYFEGVDGKREYLRWLATPWQNEQGAVAGVIIYLENISDQVLTRRRLSERESLIRDFFAESPLGLNLCRMDGLWLESNAAFLRIIGYSPEEADGGLTYWQLTPRKYDADEAVQLELLRTTRRYGPYEKEFIRKDGTLVPVRLNGFLIEREGESFIWSLIEDMTEQRALERRLDEERVKAIQSSKLATLGEMAAGFAHEINNPLGVIDLFAYSLRDAIAAGDQAHIDDAIDGIRAAAARAAHIVQGLRRFSRQTGGEPTSVVPLKSVIDDALGLCRGRITSSGVALEVDASTPVEVRGHAIELSQVLVNLLNNAHDAAAHAEASWVRVRIEDRPEEAAVAVSVEDSGRPIPEDVADRLFRPFFTTKKAGEGTGLGLSISRSIVERHGGTLDLDRAAPHTRFVMRLPRVSS